MREFTLEDFRATLDQYSKENDTAIYLELHDELIARYADLTAKLETMTLERNILYDTAVEDGLSAWTPTIDQAQELARMQSALAASEQRVKELEQFKLDLLVKVKARGLQGAETDGDKELVSDCLYILLQRTQQQLADLTAKLEVITQERDNWYGHHAKEYARARLFEQQLTEAQATIDAQLREAASLNQRITDLEAKVQRLERHLAYVKAQSVCNLVAERDQLQATVTNREHECEVLRGQRALAEAKCNRLQATVTAQQEEIGRLRGELVEILQDWEGPTKSGFTHREYFATLFAERRDGLVQLVTKGEKKGTV